MHEWVLTRYWLADESVLGLVLRGKFGSFSPLMLANSSESGGFRSLNKDGKCAHSNDRTHKKPRHVVYAESFPSLHYDQMM